MSATVVETVDRKVSVEGGGSNGGLNNNANNNNNNNVNDAQNGGSATGESTIQEQSHCLQSLKMCCKSINFGLDDLFWLLFLVMIIVFSVIKSTTRIAWSQLLWQALTVLLILIVLYWIATAFNKFVLEDSSTAHWNAHARFTAAAAETRLKEEQEKRVHVIAPPKMGGAKLNIIYTIGDVPLAQTHRGPSQHHHHHHNRHASSGSLVLGGAGASVTAPTTSSCSSTATSTPIASGKNGHTNMFNHSITNVSPTALLKGLAGQLAPIQVTPTPSTMIVAEIESAPTTPLSLVQDDLIPQPSSAHLPDTIQEEAETPAESPCDSTQNTLTERPTVSADQTPTARSLSKSSGVNEQQ